MRDLLIRIVLGLPCLGIAVWFMLQPGETNLNLLGVFPCLLAFALIVTPSSTSVAASVWGMLYMPDRDAIAKPDTKHAETHRFHRRYDAALVEYERLLQTFPDDPGLWNACFELAWVDLRDPDLARTFLAKCRHSTEDTAAQEKLHHLYSVQERRHSELN